MAPPSTARTAGPNRRRSVSAVSVLLRRLRAGYRDAALDHARTVWEFTPAEGAPVKKVTAR